MAGTTKSTLEGVTFVMVDDLFEVMTGTSVVVMKFEAGEVTEDQLADELHRLAVIFLAKYGSVPTAMVQ